jgi:hypothetical protein
MYRATIHTWLGEQFRIPYPDGALGGKPLHVFLSALRVCFDESVIIESASDADKVILLWFSNLSEIAAKPVNVFAKPLERCYYVGDYSQFEYGLLSERDCLPEDREKWKRMYAELDDRWVSVDDLVNGVTELLRLLKEVNLEPVWWYEPDDTLPEFEIFLETLILASSRGAKKVLIQFS